MRALRRPPSAALAILATMTGCSAILGLDEKRLGDLDGSAADAATASDADVTADGTTVHGDAQLEAGNDAPAGDAPPSDCPFDADGLGDVRSAGCWSSFDLTQANPGVSTAPGSEGLAFDGRYLYVAPVPGAIVLRYDSAMPFADAGSWSSFDVKAKLGFQPRFSGALFDGRYVTLVPRDTSALVVRYDTQAVFTDAASWLTFDPTTLDANLVGFAGATYDGTYDYFVPREHSLILRHDAKAANGVGWESFDLAQVYSGILTAFWGGVYDGKAVYLAPEGDGVALRYDTSKPFGAAASWSKFDTVPLHAGGLTFLGPAFDGRYVYMTPAGSDSFVARYDTQASFTSVASWSAFDMGTLTPSLGLFSGAAFDGRFFYFTPVGTTNGQPNRLMGRYDTTKTFTGADAWSIVDCTPFGVAPFDGSAFDGRFVYFSPDRGKTKMARYEARKTAQRLSLPAFFGSFF
jgi:hypothetical protein